MANLKQYLNKLTLREKTLLLCFGWLVVLFWASVLLKNITVTTKDLKETSQELSTQQIYLQNEQAISKRLAAAKSQLNDQKTISSDMLFTVIDSMARKEHLTFDLGSPQHEQTGLFTIHSIRMGIKSSKMENIICFVQELQSKSPYLNLTAFRLRPSMNNPAILNAELEIQSFEFTQKL